MGFHGEKVCRRGKFVAMGKWHFRGGGHCVMTSLGCVRDRVWNWALGREVGEPRIR